MEIWESTKYSKWYKSHRRFSFTANHLIDLYEDGKNIPDSIFKPFMKSLYCHSKSEEKMFQDSVAKDKILHEHSKISLSKRYSNDEKYEFCKSLLIHMKEEEGILLQSFLYIPK
jgi:hypothetical protein